jgi:DNA-binding HxlR family transcriptional regulator
MAGKKPTHGAEEATTDPTPAHHECPATGAIDLVAHKWTMHILFKLRQAGGPVRFRRLQQMTGPITQKELTKRLRELERSGLVHRRVYAEVPPRVEYRLTELGGTLMPALEAFSAWAQKSGPAVAEHRRRAAAAGRDGSQDVPNESEPRP